MNGFPSLQCCMDTNNFGTSRIHWKNIKDDALKVTKIHETAIILGHANFWSQNYRSCNVTKAIIISSNSSSDRGIRMPCDINDVLSAYNHIVPNNSSSSDPHIN